MNAWRISAVLVPAMALLACKAASADTPRVDMKRMSEITRVLASDKFQGRAPGTPGEAKTIPYLIAQFKAAGLEPGGDNGGWTQAVPMIRTQLKSPMTLSVEQAGQTIALKDPDDLYLGTVRPVDRLKIANAPMVFVGYGVTAPERGWDDFKGAGPTNMRKPQGAARSQRWSSMRRTPPAIRGRSCKVRRARATQSPRPRASLSRYCSTAGFSATLLQRC
jgi:hypothetical protein